MTFGTFILSIILSIILVGGIIFAVLCAKEEARIDLESFTKNPSTYCLGKYQDAQSRHVPIKCVKYFFPILAPEQREG